VGIKDYCYAALFAKEDLPSLCRLAEEIRLTHNQNLVDDFNLKCQQKYDDHNPILERDIEFLQVAKADDLIVTGGINRCIDLILGVSTTRWRYFAYGSGTTAATIADTALASENTLTSPRIDMSLFGWRESAGTTLKFAGISFDSLVTITINECGIFDAVTAGNMLNRNVFSANPITHTSSTPLGFVLSSIIEFVPMM